MPTVIRRSETVTVTDKRNESIHTVGWQVTSSLWSPPTDVYETESEHIVRIEVAGMRESDFEITFNNGILLVRGVRSDTPERRGYHQMEIHFGKFSTSIAVPGLIDLDASVAEYKDGFLIIRMPKAKKTEVKIEE
jgi:HSP20 family protein